jgi:hypothetical protein
MNQEQHELALQEQVECEQMEGGARQGRQREKARACVQVQMSEATTTTTTTTMTVKARIMGETKPDFCSMS